MIAVVKSLDRLAGQNPVIPAQAGIQDFWTPAFAEVTNRLALLLAALHVFWRNGHCFGQLVYTVPARRGIRIVKRRVCSLNQMIGLTGRQ